MDDDEKRVVDSIIQMISYRNHEKYHIASEPEKMNREIEDVECILESGDKRIAVEHTRSESFINQTSLAMALKKTREDLEHKLSGKLPSDKLFTLVMPVDLTKKLSKKKQKNVIDDIKEWIIKESLSMKERDHITRKHEDSDLIFYLSSRKSRLDLNGQLHTHLYVRDLSEADRKKRMKKAFEDKLPKLHKYKKDQFSTILAIEDIDIALSNLEFCEDAIHDLRDEFSEILPDSIYYFCTNDSKIMDAWLIKENNNFTDDIPMRGPFYDLPHGITLDEIV